MVDLAASFRYEKIGKEDLIHKVQVVLKSTHQFSQFTLRVLLEGADGCREVR